MPVVSFSLDSGSGEGDTTAMSAIPWVVMAAASAAVDCLNPLPAPGEPGYMPAPRHHFRVLFENDSAADTDESYSHGTRLDYAQDWDEHNSWGLSLTQNIYTPTTHTQACVPGEHPYAGYLALGAAYLRRGDWVGCSTELQLGTTGNPSFARYSQDAVHRACGMERWEGWSYQVPAEPTVQLSSRQDYRLAFMECRSGSWQSDALLFTRENVGTVDLSGGVGLVLRWGHNLPESMAVNGNHAADFGRGLLRVSDYRPEEMSYFLVGSVYGAYAARDITIDGGVFRSFPHKTCSRKPWQVEGQLGLGVVRRGVDYFAGMVCHSRSYRGEDKNHLYGSFAITLHW